MARKCLVEDERVKGEPQLSTWEDDNDEYKGSEIEILDRRCD